LILIRTLPFAALNQQSKQAVESGLNPPACGHSWRYGVGCP